MIINYLKTAIRNILRNKVFSLINILGLSVGMAACLLIMLWIQNELNFDKFHENRDKMYRVMAYGQKYFQSGSETTPAPLGLQAARQMPEIENLTLFEGVNDLLFQYGDKGFYQKGGIIADTSFFSLFKFKFIEGNPNHPFKNANEIIIDEEIAQKLFGDKTALGKVIETDGESAIVVGVIKTVPENSTLVFKYVIPFSYDKINTSSYGWGRFMFSTYIQLNDQANIDSIGARLTRYAIKEKCSQVVNGGIVFKLQKFSQIHLDGNHGDWRSYYNLTDKKYVIAFSIIALFILINACFNYINLSTARSERRSKEVGVRKVVGARYQNIFKQFMGESLLTSLISILIALILLELARPVFSQLSGKILTIEYGSIEFLLSALFLFLSTGLLAGSYPSIIMSSFSPISLLRKSFQSMRSGIFRNILVIIQFFIASILIIGSVIIIKQLNFIGKKDLGFDKSHIVSIPFKENLAKNYRYIKSQLLQDPNIISVTASDYAWADNENRCGGCFAWEGIDVDNMPDMHIPSVDFDFFKTLGVEIVSGRDFSSKISSDSTAAVMINESAAMSIGVENPLVLPASMYEFSTSKRKSVQIIGVFKDFNYGSLHRKIEPQVVRIERRPENFSQISVMLVKINPINREAALRTLEKTWYEVNNVVAFEYRFLDQIYEGLYKSDQDMGTLIIYFTVFSILIACLGILGLTIFIAERKTKEIGIRKVNGASIWNIVWIIIGKFMIWVSVAFVLAIPISYIIMEEVLMKYSYRISIGFVDYLIALFIVVLVTLSTCIYQAYSAATSNPVKALQAD
jgi:putative ABC transport system permease protein